MTTSKNSFLKSDIFVAVVLTAVAFIILLATVNDIGLTWDEPAYIAASESYTAWFGEFFSDPTAALSPESIEMYWEINHEHPPLDKIWSGVFWAVSRALLPDLVAHRLGNMILSSMLIGFIFLLVADVYERWVGIAAAAFLFLMPRFFFHAHLAALDVAAAVMIVATVLAFWKTRMRQSWAVDVGLGLLWGAAVATKVNAVFILPTLFLWLLIFERQKRLLLRLLVMGVVALPVFFISWPWLYHETIGRTIEYILFITVDHWEIGQWYLNRFYMPPPWHFPFAITLAVVPVMTLLLFFIGSIRVLAQKAARKFGAYLLLNAFVPILALAIGQSMVYDNDRLFIGSIPFVAAIAAIGLYVIVQVVKKRVQGAVKVAILTVLALVVFMPSLISAATVYPHLLSYYSGLVGGVSGATQLGLETTYWCETYSEVLDYLNENAEAGDIVWVDPWSHDVMVYYQQQGQLRDDLRFTAPFRVPSILDEQVFTVPVSIEDVDFVVSQSRQTTLGPEGRDSALAKWLAVNEPDYVFDYGNTRLIAVYNNK